MMVSFEYWTPRMNRGHLTIDLDKFFPNTQKNVRKLFKLMLPELPSEKVSEVREYLRERTQPAVIDWGSVEKRRAEYLEKYRECQKKLQTFGKREKAEQNGAGKQNVQEPV